MIRIRLLLPVHCFGFHTASPSFRYVSAIFTVLFAVVIICMVIIEFTRITSGSKTFKLRRNHQQPTDIHDDSLNYGVVIDCGSSGSRAFIYFWPKHSGNPKDLLLIQPMRDKYSTAVNMKIEPDMYYITPGISDLAKIPQNASDYLTPLLKFALSNIPKHRHSETLLYVLATAGMRLLPQAEQEAIMTDLRTDIPAQYPFSIADNQFEVITGKQEGVYTWVAINYVLKKFEHGNDPHPLVAVTSHGAGTPVHIRRRTVGILDMGGASTQIAYEVPQAVSFDRDETAMSLMAEVSLGCQHSDLDHNYRVYVATFLGKGANSARQQYEDNLIQSTLHNTTTTNNGHTVETAIPDPCLPVGMPRAITQSENQESKTHFIGTGNYRECRKSLLPLLNLTKSCEKYPCSLNGVFQPTLNFYNSEIYGFSEFWYTTDDILGIGGLYDHKQFDYKAKEYCGMDYATLSHRFHQHLYPRASQFRLDMQCFKSAWISAVLHDGFRVPRSYKQFHAVNLIDNQPVQWTLGALLHRSRYLPLQDMELAHLRQTPTYHAPWLVITPYFSTYIFAGLILVVILSIILYIRHLRSASLRQTFGLHKVPSMAYLTTLTS